MNQSNSDKPYGMACAYRDDKNNPRCNFTPPVTPSSQTQQASEKLVGIVKDPNLDNVQKRDAMWKILNR